MDIGCSEYFKAFNLQYSDTGLFGFFTVCDELAAEHCKLAGAEIMLILAVNTLAVNGLAVSDVLPLYVVSKSVLHTHTLKCEDVELYLFELYLFDRALQLEAGKSPSTVKEALQKRCENGSKIVEKWCLASKQASNNSRHFSRFPLAETRFQLKETSYPLSAEGNLLSAQGN